MHPIFDKINELGRDRVPFLFILDYALKRPLVFPLAHINADDLAFTMGGWSNEPLSVPAIGDLQFEFTAPNRPDFQQAFDAVQKELHAGNTYLTNLCFKVPISTNWSLDTIFAQASAKYKLRYRDEFVFFSPEAFVTIRNGRIATFPMKGTIDATMTNAPNQLLSDPKEDAEHATIVDLLRNDLSRVAKKVQLKRFKYLDYLETNRGPIWQMSSEIEGILPNNYPSQIGTILSKLLPAGSITGAPKPKTVHIIDSIEKDSRGFYTGVAGVFDGVQMDSTVMIRFVEKQGGQLYYRTGGGITAQSDSDKEYKELLQKIYIPPKKERFLVETISLHNGRLKNLSWHQKRLDKSRKQLGFGSVLSLKKSLAKVIRYDFGSQQMKCRVVYGKQIEQVELTAYKPKAIATLQCVEISSFTERETTLKWADRHFYQNLLAQKGEADDVLIIRDGWVTDISFANVALYDGAIWWTPTQPLLEGTLRAKLLAEGIIQEKKIRQADLGNYQKLRFFNALIGWGGAVDVDCRQIICDNLLFSNT